ncbi:IstB domain protein ATP-binding protein, partial [mine drainage metagenome]
RRLRQLGLYGLLAHAEELLLEPWLTRLLEIEESERLQRSLKRRLDAARLGAFKPMADFDYQWPKQLDRSLLDELFTFEFLEQAANIIVVGPNGLGKSMIAKNLLHQAVLRGYTARFTAASDMLTILPPRTAPRSSPDGYAATPLPPCSVATKLDISPTTPAMPTCSSMSSHGAISCAGP